MAECRGKRRYSTLAEAQRALEDGKRTWHYPPARWYVCPVCHGYHLSGKRAATGLKDQERAFIEARERREASMRRRNNPFDVLGGQDA